MASAGCYCVLCESEARKRVKKRERDDEFVLRDGSTSDEFKFRGSAGVSQREARALLGQRRSDRDGARLYLAGVSLDKKHVDCSRSR